MYASGPAWPSRRAGKASELEAFYGDVGGGYFWDGSLLVRPLVALHDQPMDVVAWNERDLWKGRYGVALRSVTCFAEDVFGGQFGLTEGGNVVRFNPETGETAPFAASLQEWATQVANDADFETGVPVLKSWERAHGRLKSGCRLLPRQPFFLGGDYVAENLVEKRDVDAMLVRAELWEVTRDIPDGSKIVIRPTS